jgi:hypothetical protein
MVRLLRRFLVLAAVIAAMPAAARGAVIVYRYENFTEGYTVDHTVRCLKELTRTYPGECCHSCHHGEDLCCDPCTRTASLNDDLRAIEITGTEEVEVYEHCGFDGWRLVFQGPGRWVFPAHYWDKASALAIH